MSPDEKNLARLEALSKTLNKESDSLNALIEALEERLSAMNIGVSLWPNVNSACSREWTETEAGYDTTIEKRLMEQYEFGYCKIGDQWRVATRKAKYEVTDWKSASEDYELLEHGEPIPLVSAPRIVRLEAAKCLDELIEMLCRKIEDFVENIQEAKKSLQ